MLKGEQKEGYKKLHGAIKKKLNQWLKLNNISQEEILSFSLPKFTRSLVK
jgi:hypothetical protein